MAAQPLLVTADSLRQHGVVRVVVTGPAGVALARTLGLGSNGDQPAQLVISGFDAADPCTPMVWTRTFGDVTWSSRVALTPTGNLVERIGPLSIYFDVDFDDDRLVLRSQRWGIGALRWRRSAGPRVLATVTNAGASTVSTVAIDRSRWGSLRYVATMNAVGAGGS